MKATTPSVELGGGVAAPRARERVLVRVDSVAARVTGVLILLGVLGWLTAVTLGYARLR